MCMFVPVVEARKKASLLLVSIYRPDISGGAGSAQTELSRKCAFQLKAF